MAVDMAPAILLCEIISEFGAWRPEPAHAPVCSAFLIQTPGVSP
jgi:hypothetical protein